jgi:HD-like signal output (HDOD) protein
MSSTSDIEKVMGNDQSLTTKVLKLANSAYYAIPGGVSSLQRAIAYIGYDAIHQLVLSASIIDALKIPSRGERFDLNQFWKHSVGVAMAAETTARFVHYKSPTDLFTCGLVHDMGKIALLMLVPEQFLEAVIYATDRKTSLDEAELRLGLPRHTQTGHQLACRWRLPSMIQAVVLWHHQKDINARPGLSAELSRVVDIVYLANLLINGIGFGNSGHGVAPGVPKVLMERMYMTPEKLKDLIAQIKAAIASADNFLSIIEG